VLALREPLEHGSAGGIGERVEDEVEPRGLMFNHAVEHNGPFVIVNRAVE
jgi:hypothetical protein